MKKKILREIFLHSNIIESNGMNIFWLLFWFILKNNPSVNFLFVCSLTKYNILQHLTFDFEFCLPVFILLAICLFVNIYHLCLRVCQKKSSTKKNDIFHFCFLIDFIGFF